MASTNKTTKEEKPKYFAAIGRRKTATAQARLFPVAAEVVVGEKKLSRGEIYVNGLPIETYFPDPFSRAVYLELYRTTNAANRFVTTVLVEGSGRSGQLGAVVLAVARAMVKADPALKAVLRKKGFLTRDPRAKEREKPGLAGARKEKQSPKR